MSHKCYSSKIKFVLFVTPFGGEYIQVKVYLDSVIQ